MNDRRTKFSKAEWDKLIEANQAEFHPVSQIYEMLSYEDLNTLAASIAANGLLEPVLIDYDTGLIVDGRNRLVACEALGVEVVTREWTTGVADHVSLFDFVVSTNTNRRSQTPSQKAMTAVLSREFYSEAEADGVRLGQPGRWRDLAGRQFGVSPSLVQTALNVFMTGEPRVIDAVRRGTLSVVVASNLVKETADTQNKLMEETPAKTLPKKVRELRKGRDGAKASKEKGVCKACGRAF